MYTLYRIACAPTQKPYRVHKGNPDFDAVLTTERGCAASILKVNRQGRDRFSYTLWHRVNRFSTAAEVNTSEGGLNSTIFVLCLLSQTLLYSVYSSVS